MSVDHGKSWASGGKLEGDLSLYDGPYEGEVVELFEKAPTGGASIMLRVLPVPSHHCSECP